MMKLYITRTSPYARLARIVVLEKKLQDRIEIIEAQTRKPASPYYRINPSGRVPYLLREDGTGMEDSQLICAWLDNLDGKPQLTFPPAHQEWEYGRLEGAARSMVDGISVWGREMRRPEFERSPTILQHELDRYLRMADLWEREIGHALLQGPLNMPQLILIAGLDRADHDKMADVLSGRANLAAWAGRMRQVPSVASTAPGA
jgi:glutathione S-transferase